MAVFPSVEDTGTIMVLFGDRGGSPEEVAAEARGTFSNWIEAERTGTDSAAVGPFDGAWVAIAISTAANVLAIVEFIQRWRNRGAPVHIGMGAAVELGRQFLLSQGVEGAEFENGSISWHGFGKFIVANLPDAQCTYFLFFREGARRHRLVITSTGELISYEQSRVESHTELGRHLL